MNERFPPENAKEKPAFAGTIFWICFKIGLTSFGGGLSGWFHREFVVERKWVTDEEFISSFALSQMLPGANIINLLIDIGDRLAGAKGSVAAVLGLVSGPFFFVIGAAAFVKHFSSNIAAIGAISSGIAFAAVGLLVLVCIRGLNRTWHRPERLAIVAVTAIGVGVMRWPLPLVVLAIAPVSVFFAWRRL